VWLNVFFGYAFFVALVHFRGTLIFSRYKFWKYVAYSLDPLFIFGFALVVLFAAILASTALAMPTEVLSSDNMDYNVTAGNPRFYNDPSEVSESNGYPLFKQCGNSWSPAELGRCGGTSICKAGCAMSSVAMMLDGHGLSLNPGTLNSWLDSHGGYASGCEIVWSAVNAFGKVSYQGMETASEATICAGLAAGHGIIGNVNGGHHWVLLTGCRGGGVYTVNDPGFKQPHRSMSQIGG